MDQKQNFPAVNHWTEELLTACLCHDVHQLTSSGSIAVLGCTTQGQKKKHAKGARLSWESKGTDSSNNTKYKLCKTVGVCYSLMRVIQASLLLSVKIQSSHKLFFHNTKHWLIINRTFFHTFKDISYFLFLNIKKQLPNKRASSHQLGPWDL